MGSPRRQCPPAAGRLAWAAPRLLAGEPRGWWGDGPRLSWGSCLRVWELAREPGAAAGLAGVAGVTVTCPGVRAEQPRENPGRWCGPPPRLPSAPQHPPPLPPLVLRLGASRAPAPPDPPASLCLKHCHLGASTGRLLSAPLSAVPACAGASSMLKAWVSGLRSSLPTKTGAMGTGRSASLVLDALDPRRLWDPRRPSRRLGGQVWGPDWRGCILL